MLMVYFSTVRTQDFRFMSRSAHRVINKNGRRLARRLLTSQLIVALVCIALFGLMSGRYGALSAALGAVICLLPNILFAMLVFQYGGARSALTVMSSFYTGEALKILLSMALLIVVLINFNGPLLPLFVVFITLSFLNALAPIFTFKN